MEGYRVESIDETRLAAWDSYVRSRPDFGSMHHAAWFKILSNCSAVRPIFLAAIDPEDRICGIMPCYCSASIFSGRHIATLRGGIVADSADVAESLHGAALSCLEDSPPAGYLLERGGTRTRSPAAAGIEVVHTVVDTRDPADVIFERLKKKMRWEIRQALNFADELRELAGEGTEDFYRLYRAHQHHLGTPVVGLDFFNGMFAHLGNDARMFAIIKDGNMAAAMICVSTASGWSSEYVAFDQALRRADVGYALYWKVIEWMSLHETTAFDLGRSTPGSGVHRFKQKWRGSDIHIRYNYFGARLGKSFHAAKAMREGRTLRQQVWRMLPAWAADTAGPWMRRQDPFG
jgi:hypothetical protein